MTNTAETLQRGYQFHRSGDLARAAEVYRGILQSDRTNVDVLCLLGSATIGLGQLDEAIGHLQEAQRLNPTHAATYDNLGIALVKLDRLDEAVEFFQQALQFDSNNVDTYLNLGIALTKQGKLSDAELIYERAIRRWPGSAIAHFQLGNLLKERNQLDEAFACYQRALLISPNDPRILNNLGVVLLARGQLDDAVVAFQQAIRIKPDFAGAFSNLSNTFREQGRIDDAVSSCRRAVELEPNSPEAHNSLGTALLELGQPHEALEHVQHALRIKPTHTIALINQTSVLLELGKQQEALESADGAVNTQPEFPEARMNRSIVRLKLGNFAEGWSEYEWRWQTRNFAQRHLSQPRWDGSPLAGRTILLHFEQGLGDTLQFIRYAPLVKQSGGRVIVECQEALQQVLSSAPGVDQLIVQGQPLPEFDVQAPLMSLPSILGTTLDTVPAQIPYLFADRDLEQQWRDELRKIRGFKIGIVWQGNQQHKKDRQRSFPLVCFAGLAHTPGVQLISLQKGPGTEQIPAAATTVPLIDLGNQLDEATGPFMDTAAIMRSLDLVITADTATAHLAGALGVPLWLALAISADFRWLVDRDDSPWYPTMRLFRQTRSGDWRGVFEQMVTTLQPLLRRSQLLPVTVEIAPGELFDKITILEIKHRRIADEQKLQHVRAELATLTAARDGSVESSPELEQLVRELQQVNETLWEIEDALRLCEGKQDFGPQFVELARSVYRHNDQRAAIKRQINERLGSRMIEEKSYAKYT
jgi:tetratricopeptide (TPR) repeat protein